MARDEGGAGGGMYSWHETQPAMILADAQVHAILALAAATAIGAEGPDAGPWHQAAATRLT